MDKLNNNALKKLKNEKGITLMVVIITIIVMVILLGVTVRLSIEGELISSAEKVENSTIGEIEEGQEKIDSIIAERDDATILDDAFVPQYVEESYSDGNGLKNYRIYGNSVQNGTPTPTSPIEIQSVGDKTKNLFKTTNNVVGTITPTTAVINSGYKWATTTDFIFLEAGTYTISYKTGINLRHVVIFNQEKELVSYLWSNRKNPYTFTVNENCLVRIDFERAGNVNIENLETFYTEYEVQLEKGNTNTVYEPYGYKIPIKATNEAGESVTTNIYLDEPLRKIGDYADFIDFKNNRVVRNIHSEEIKFTSTTQMYICGSKWQRENCTSVYCLSALDYNGLQTPKFKEYEKSNMFKGGYWEWSDMQEPFNYILCGHNSSLVYLIIENSYLNNINNESTDDDKKNAIKEFFDNNKLLVEYVMAVPIQETIELPKINTLEGKNTITIQTKIQPSNVTLEF